MCSLLRKPKIDELFNKIINYYATFKPKKVTIDGHKYAVDVIYRITIDGEPFQFDGSLKLETLEKWDKKIRGSKKK